jgi:hypothetical protein
VNSYSEYQALFGDTFRSGSDYYQYLTSHTAKEYLKHGSKLTVVRILDGAYGGASATISSSIDPAIIGGGTKPTASLTFTTTAATVSEGVGYLSGSGQEASWSMGGVTFAFTASAAQITQSATRLTARLGTVTNLAKAGGSASFAMRELINLSSSVHNFDISASIGSIGSHYTDVSTVLTMSWTGGAGAFGEYGHLVGGSASGSGWSSEQGIITSSVSMSANNLQGAHDGPSGSTYETFIECFKLNTLADGYIMNNSASVGTQNVLGDGTKDNIRFEISTANNKKGTFTLLLRRGDDNEKRKQTLETWNNLSLDENSNNYIGKMIGDQVWTLQGSGGTDPYLQLSGSYPNKSKYVRVSNIKNTTDYLDENGNVRVPAASASLPAYASGSSSGSFGGSFGGASDGTVQTPKNFYDKITDANSQGLILTSATEYEDAINLLGNQDEYDINLVLMPGVTDGGTGGSALISKAIDMCEDRGDCFVIADPGLYDQALSTATDKAEARDSSYAAMYYPWIQIGDADLGKNVWVPPSTVMAGVYTFNDKISHPWFAPAGLNRGGIDMAIQAERKLTHSNRDTLYESNVNPIATFPGQGVTVWGQKTLQKKASALDRINVRRLLIKVKKFIASSSRFLVFEQNTNALRKRFLSIANPFLEQVQSNSGLNAFRVVMDESNNPPDVIDRNILYGQIFLQPTRTAEFIVLDFTVQPTGATFPE